MVDLQKFEARVCETAGGILIWENKVLLVKHKKLKIWLSPGGHVDEGELPHRAAEREFWEETGVEVKAITVREQVNSNKIEYLPIPLFSQLHWISRDNYEARLKSKNPKKPHGTKLWPLGCEQHLGWSYLVEPLTGVIYKQNVEETDGIAWFEKDEIKELETTEDIKRELLMAFGHSGTQ